MDIWKNNQRAKLRDRGLCIDCKQPHDRQTLRCTICASHCYSLAQKRRVAYEVKGLCQSCGKKKEDLAVSVCVGCQIRAKNNYAANPNKYIKSVRERSYYIKEEVFSRYGGKCIKCGEDRLPCLELDHINGGGSNHRESLGIPRSGGGVKFYRALLLANKYPIDLQILCANCHAIKHCKYMEVVHATA